jgi:hypothetical protein
MPKINLIAPVVLGADEAETAQGALEIVNGYVETISKMPSIKMRPGLKELHDTGSNARVDLYWWEAKRTLLIATGRKIYAKTTQAGSLVDVSPVTANDTLPFNVKVLFAADEYGVTMTAGRHMLWWGGDTGQPAYRIVDANAPTRISSLVYLKGYMIASIPNTQRFQWALYGPTDSRTQPPPWNPLSISASATPDDIICMGSGWEELFILGRESAQSHYASGDVDIPFPALNGSVSETGTVNANTLCKLGNAWMFFTPNYEVVRMEGRNPTVVSREIDQALRELEHFDDAEAFTLFDRFYVLTFTQDQRTFVMDLTTGLWFRWESWDEYVTKFRQFKGVTAVLAKSWGQQIVGGSTGLVYESSYELAADEDDLIRLQMRSGFIDHGTLDRKFSANLQMRLRTGEYGVGSEVESFPESYSNNWQAVTKLDQTPIDILYATDGFVYILGSTKIWKTTTAFETFTEMTLSGTITGTGFGTLAQVSGNRVVTMDQRYLWVMAAGSDTFTKTAYGNSNRYFAGGFPVTSLGASSPMAFAHGTNASGSQANVVGYNLDTGTNTGTLVIAVGSLAVSKTFPGMQADNGTMVIASCSDNSHYAFLYRAAGTSVRLGLGYAPVNANYQPVIDKTPDGTIYIYSNTKESAVNYMRVWKSTDDGETWTTYLSTAAELLSNPRSLVGLVGDDLFLFRTDDVHRSTNGLLAVGGSEFEFDGVNLTRARMLTNYKIAALTNGSTTNLYTLQGTPPHIEVVPSVNRKLLIRWRNDGRNKWSNYRDISLGEAGQYTISRKVSGLGCYRTRQYEIVCTSGGPVTITGIEEDAKLGGTSG